MYRNRVLIMSKFLSPMLRPIQTGRSEQGVRPEKTAEISDIQRDYEVIEISDLDACSE